MPYLHAPFSSIRGVLKCSNSLLWPRFIDSDTKPYFEVIINDGLYNSFLRAHY